MSKLADEWLERQDHPLLNTVILDKVFRHVGRKDLKGCRLVCKTWNVLTIPFMRVALEALEVKIIGNNSMEDFVDVFRSNNLGIPIPFSRFQFGSCCLTDEIGQEFLQLFGDTIKSVRFYNCTVEDLSELLKSTPNLEIFETPSVVEPRNYCVVQLFPEDGTKPKLSSLKRLIVSEIHYGHYGVHNTFCPTYLEELITVAENISSLHLANAISSDDDSDEEYNMVIKSPGGLEVLKIIEKLGRESSIHELTITHSSSSREDDEDYTAYFDLLHKMAEKSNGLKLKSFECNSSDLEGLFPLISLFKDTLEHLKLNMNYCYSLAEFPKMTVLKTLSVWLSVCWSHNFNSGFVNFKEIFPVLEELKLGQLRSHQLNELFLESEPCPLMTSLELHNLFLNINGFKQVIFAFPNLTRLSINIKEESLSILPQIWSEMTQLKYLAISGTIQSMNSYGLESYFTGSQLHALQRVGDVFNHMEGMTSEIGRRDMILKLRNQHCQLPSIVNLIDLRSLTLNLAVKEKLNSPARNGLTDLTGYLGLYSMKRLKNLTVRNCEFTKTCCEILTKELRLESWTFKTSLNREIIPSQSE